MMTDTRKECEQWQIESGENYADGTFDESYFLPFDAGYNACQSLNEKRIQQLMAVIELQRQALQKISDMDYGEPDRMKKCKHEKYHWEDCEQCIHEVVDEALAITPEDVELEEVGVVCFEDTLVGVDLTNPTVKHGDTVYTIKQKG